MPITISQTPGMPDGAARLTATTAPAGAEMRIARLDKGAPRYLDPRETGDAAWGAADVWFRPANDETGGLTVGPEVTWHLKPHMPYAVSFRGADGTVIEDRMVWKALRLPSEAPPPSMPGGLDLPRETPAADPEPPIDDLAAFADDPVPEPVAPTPEPRVVSEPAAKEGNAKMWIGALLLILLLAVGGYYAAYVSPGFLNDEPETVAETTPASTTETVTETAPQPVTLEWAREFLQSSPSATDAAAEALRFADAGQPNAAFLIRRYAARAGDAAAAEALGDMYAPDTWKAGVIKAADPVQALTYFEQSGAVTALEKAIALVESDTAPVADKPAKLTALNDALAKAKDTE